MKIIASTGGKGGVGKSTFSILLAFKLVRNNKKVILCDCDVECPNDYLILNQELKNPNFIYQEYPELEKEKCKKCGLCSNVCKEHAIFWVEDKHPTFFYELCCGCGACWIVCPNKAIKTRKEIVGELFVNKVNDNFWLITGRSKTGVSKTSPIVRAVKDEAIKFAKAQGADYLLIDTSSGTHCNVIQALLGCDKAYCVTEPTPLGAHDLELILKLLRKLKIPFEIVLNKAGVGSRSEVEKIGRKFNVKISIEIPYSERLIKAYCEKQMDKMVKLV